MTKEQYLKNLNVPIGKIDVILDTDAYNEIDDQYAIAYLLKSGEKLNVLGFTAAPFLNKNSLSPQDGMEKSYEEIKKVISIAGREDIPVYRGSDSFLIDEKTPVISEAAEFIAEKAMKYSPQTPLYVVAIGAITNVASSLLIKPEIVENIVIVWLGGNSHEFGNCREFNMFQDVAAARVVMTGKSPFIQLPCRGVVSEFRFTGPELEFWLLGKNKISNYLAENTIRVAETYGKGRPWSRVIWDVTAIGWLLDEEGRFMKSRIINTALPQYDGSYKHDEICKLMRYVYFIERDNLAEDLFNTLLK